MTERHQLEVIDRIEDIKLDQGLKLVKIAEIIRVTPGQLNAFMHLALGSDYLKRKIDHGTMAMIKPKERIKTQLLWPKV